MIYNKEFASYVVLGIFESFVVEVIELRFVALLLKLFCYNGLDLLAIPNFIIVFTNEKN